MRYDLTNYEPSLNWYPHRLAAWPGPQGRRRRPALHAAPPPGLNRLALSGLMCYREQTREHIMSYGVSVLHDVPCHRKTCHAR